MSTADAILLVAHGSPETPADVPAFLRNITSGRPIPQSVIDEVQHRYSLIGRSPLLDITMQQAESLRCKSGLPVYVGMRNWKPYIADAVAQMVKDGITRAAAICLAPQNSQTSVGLYKRAVFAAAGSKLQIVFIDSWHDNPMLIGAFAEKLRAAWEPACTRAQKKIPVIFTAHSVPEKTIQAGDPYEIQARETAALVARQVPELNSDDWKFAFQSQGMSGDKWLGPTVQETILKFRAAGQSAVLLQPIGSLCDHVEVLYDIDIDFKEFAKQQGIELFRAESLNDSSLLADALAALARTTLAGAHSLADSVSST